MARKKRGQGEGSIYQRNDGRWAASMSLGGRKRKTFYGKTRREVQEQLKAALREQQQGTLATGKAQRLKDYLEQWVEEVQKPMVKPQTYEVYRSNLNHHIIPALGTITVQALTPQDVQRLYIQKQRAGLSAATIRGIHAVLHEALANAVRWNMIPRNVCDLVSLPRIVAYEAHTLTIEQAQQLLEAAKGHWLEPMLVVAITTGLRQGELLGLHWSDIDFNEKRLYVRRTVVRIGRTGIQESTPKTERSKNTVALADVAIAALAHIPFSETGIVFCRGDGRYLAASSVRVAFKQLLQAAGLPDIRFHDLRHSAATLLMSMGVHPKVVQEILRHTTFRQTMETYSHVSSEMQADAMDKWDNIFAKNDDF